MMKQQGQFLLFDRDGFKDWLFKTQFKRHIVLIQDHCTAGHYKNFTGNNHFVELSEMRSYHMAPEPKGRGFNDIAQNLTTFPDGTIAVCRSFESDPAGIYGANKGALCIENYGNFDKGMDVMSEEHKKSIVFLNAVLCMRFGLQPSAQTIVYHAWYNRDTGKRDNEGANKPGNYKSCPGTNFFGGNSLIAMTKNFLPLVVKEIENQKNNGKSDEITLDQAIDIWVAAGVISDPAGMRQEFNSGKLTPSRFSALLIKTAKYIKK